LAGFGFESPGNRRRPEEPEGDADEPAFVPLFGGSRDEVITEFRDPLTGDRLTTSGQNPEPQSPNPAFLGVVER